jgi:hypothetical protein
MWPVFVFGTGRCGSTHMQRLITLSTYCWIWGEHEGFLAPLLESVSRCAASQRLEANVFRASARTDDELISDMSFGSERLSWLNRFQESEFRTEVALLLDKVFRPGLPRGWTEWGFKEILYGLDNNAPAILLHLFTNATAMFTFREPKSTIQSMIRTWSPQLLWSHSSLGDLVKIYKIRVWRWKIVMRYFLNYRERYGNRITFVSRDKLKLPVTEVLQTVGLQSTRALSVAPEITNRGPNIWPEWARKKFDELYREDETECMDLFTRACQQSDADFSTRRPHIDLF